VADAASNTITSYAFDKQSGSFAQLGVVPSGSSPSVINVDCAGKFVYVWNAGSQDVGVYSMGADGKLAVLSTMSAGTAVLSAVTLGGQQ
jgi:6-phosphogluconolactonase (cycloisomerase 2 family)